MHIAAGSGNATLVNALLVKKPNVEVKDRNGNTPLLAALDVEQYVEFSNTPHHFLGTPPLRDKRLRCVLMRFIVVVAIRLRRLLRRCWRRELLRRLRTLPVVLLCIWRYVASNDTILKTL
jgi:hypothetical protein